MLVSEHEANRSDGPESWFVSAPPPSPVALHLRGLWTAAEAHDAAASLVRLRDVHDHWVVVNGRPDIALAVGADAVQLGHTALGVEATRRLVEQTGRALAIGASVHDRMGAVRAAAEGADLLILGTIYATPSHPGREGRGPEHVAAVRDALEAAGTRVPILAIGGITPDRVTEVLGAGAFGVVVGRAVWSAPNPREACAALLDRIEAHASA